MMLSKTTGFEFEAVGEALGTCFCFLIFNVKAFGMDI